MRHIAYVIGFFMLVQPTVWGMMESGPGIPVEGVPLDTPPRAEADDGGDLIAFPDLSTSERTRYVVGFHGLPRGMQEGDVYNGGTIVLADPVLHFAAVVTDAPALFEARTAFDPRVKYVNPDPELQLITFTPNDPRYPNQYGPQQVRAPEAWDTTLGDLDAKVCIVDTGVRHTHEEIAGSRWLGGHDYVNGDTDPMDDNGHGTHVAGTAAGGLNNGKGIAGIGNVGIYGVKVLNSAGSGTFSAIASGIRWCADNGGPRTVISMSLGGSSGTAELQSAVEYAWGQGALVVAAAGNSGPCSNCVSYPAKYPDAMAVTCTTSSESQCGFSSDGPESELTAPGSSIEAPWHTSNTAYNTISGTSMSTPHVSGVAALVWSHATDLTNANLRTLLQENARDVGSAGWDEQFGYGIVDAKATLDAAGGGGTPPPPPPSENQVFYEDFDDGAANGWALTGLWHVSSACSTPPTTPNYLGYNEDSDCQYSTGAATAGTAAFDVDLTGASVGTLKFQHRWETESYSGAYDVMRVQVSTNGGSTWTTLQQWDSRDSNQPTWGDRALDLDAYTGGILKVRFQFDSVDGSFNDFAGWFLDNVEVTADIDGGGTPPPNSPPVANAGSDQTASDDDGDGSEPVTLDGSGSTDTDGTIASYEWREGGTLIATGATPTVTLGVGSHSVTLTVTDDDGATDTDTVVVTVNANAAPTASFTHGVSSLTVSVDGSGSGDPDGSIVSYGWDWGDGATGSGVTASHTYGAAGTYTVTLTVTDNGGATDSTSKQVTVAAGEAQVYFENFDDGSAQGWTKSSSSDLWHLEDGCVVDYTAAYKLAWTRSGNCDYNTGSRVTNWAQSGAISLAGKTQATLQFVHQFDIEQYSGGAYDRLLVQASADGASWTTLQQWDSRNSDVTAWTGVSYDIDAYAGGDLHLRFYTDTVDSFSNAHAGWYVDDIEVTAS